MSTENNLPFISQRIYEIRSALMYSLSNALVKLPTSIVTALKVDEEGQVWFMTGRPTQSLDQFEWYFPATLRFYRKGKPFYVTVTGNAVIVDKPSEMHEWLDRNGEQDMNLGTDLVLMKLKIDKVEYFESEVKAEKTFSLKKLVHQVYDWVFGSPASYKPWTVTETVNA